MLKQFIEENGGKDLLLECEEEKTNNDEKEPNVIGLTDSHKTKLVNLIADYGVTVFGLSPLPHEYRLLAVAAVDLIPGLKSMSDSPIVRELVTI